MKISNELNLKDSTWRAGQGGIAKPGFKQALLQASSSSVQVAAAASVSATQQYTVRGGDTMVAIAHRALEAKNLDSSDQASTRAAFQLARSNGIANPDMIRPGQVINLANLGAGERSVAELRSERSSVTVGRAVVFPVAPPRTSAPAQVAARVLPHAQLLAQSSAGQTANPVMEKMLDRAVSMQFIDPAQKDAVREKIVAISTEYKFKPDDLATVMLMESDGMNPKANNGRCYGVIQFCEGPNKGAASVGYADNPKGILKLGVLDQLDLVKKYFDETGLKKLSPASLDDLYLTVLKPTSRKERDPTANLEIPGYQAAVLYPGNDRNLPITRQSLLAGLQQNARGKLAMDMPRAAAPAKVAAAPTGGMFIKAAYAGSTVVFNDGDGRQSGHEL
jgi:hypothetical protein